ncbi:MAG: helix-turn-helix domain-containing protein [Anaerolineales bacterium]|nr:helix-turn-helix domain-containing protein [Anaerolineales bacterium]
MNEIDFNTLSAKQVKAITLLKAGYSASQTAKKVHVNRTTLWRWLQKRDFLLALHDAKRDDYYEMLETIANWRFMQQFATFSAQQPPAAR